MTAAMTRSGPVVDLRLVPSALAVWAVTLLGLTQGWLLAAVLAVPCVLAVPIVQRRAKSAAWLHGVLVVLVMIGVAGAGVAVREHQIQQHPLRMAAEQGERAAVRVTLKSKPKPLHGTSYGVRKAEDRALVQAELVNADLDGHRVRAGGRVLLLVPTESWRALIPGQQVTATGKSAPPRAGELLVATMQVTRQPGGVAAAPAWQRVAEELREGLRRTSAAVLSPVAAGLLPGLVVGDTSGLPPEVVQEFETSGLAHLMAVSGANLAIVCGAMLLFLRFVGAGPLLAAAGAGLALIGFVVLAGPEPSVLRAAVMGAVTLVALVLGRERSALPTLAASVIGLLLVFPDLATTVGFALSVVATAGLVLLAPGWSSALHARGVPVGIAEAVAVPAAAHVVTAPLIAAISGEVSVVAVLANLLTGPVIAPATVLGVVTTVLVPMSSWVGEMLVRLAAPELEWVTFVARYAAAMPGAAFDWPSGSFGGLLLAGVVVIALVVLRSKRIRWALAAFLLLVGIVLVPVRGLSPRWPPQGWSVVTCDVGQGDGLVLSTGVPGEAVIVDTGPDPELSRQCLRRLGVQRVPLVVLTHLHADHVSGLGAVLADQDVTAVGLGALNEPSRAKADIDRDTRANRVPVRRLSPGQRMRWPGLVLDVLGPRGSLARTGSPDDANDASTVLMATTPAGRVLLTGDVELRGQSQLLASGIDLRADVLKIPHHGSRYTTPRFLHAVRPRLALISVGQGNSYGHPSSLVLGALSRAGTKILRTDHHGDIAVRGGSQGIRTVSRGDPVRKDDP